MKLVQSRLQLIQQKAINKYLEKLLNEKETLMREIHHGLITVQIISVLAFSLQIEILEIERVHDFKDYVNTAQINVYDT